MRKHISRIVSLCVMLALLVALVPVASVSAITWDNVDANATYASRYTSYYYSTGKYYSNMTKVPLTGDGPRDVVAVALTQSGYLEGDSSAGLSGEIGGSTNYSEYGEYMGVSGYSGAAWCASFCSWCIYTAEVTDQDGYYYMARDGYYWAETYVPYWSQMLYDQGRYKYADYYRSTYGQSSYAPQPGDLIFFTYYETPLDEDHVGLVVYSDGTYVYTMEGNTSSQDGLESEGGGAFFKKYALSSSNIAGYGILPYDTRDDLPEIDYSGENPTNGLYVNPSGAKSVYANRDDSSATWTLPTSSVFEVSKIEEDDLGNTMLYSKCEIDGEIVYGWITMGSGSNSYTRTVQIYASSVKTLETDAYEVTKDSKIKGLSAGTTVEAFLSNVTTEGEIEVRKGETLVSDTAKLGTGMVVNVIDNGEVISSYKVVVKGDTSGDGRINGIDYIQIKRHILNAAELTDVYYEAGCIVRTEKLTAYDYIMVKRHVLGDVDF